jgi:hypothetical protein
VAAAVAVRRPGLGATTLGWLRARLGRSAPYDGAGDINSLAEALARHGHGSGYLAHLADLDAGIWGWPLYRAAARAAIQIKAVSVCGDELAPPDA